VPSAQSAFSGARHSIPCLRSGSTSKTCPRAGSRAYAHRQKRSKERGFAVLTAATPLQRTCLQRPATRRHATSWTPQARSRERRLCRPRGCADLGLVRLPHMGSAGNRSAQCELIVERRAGLRQRSGGDVSGAVLVKIRVPGRMEAHPGRGITCVCRVGRADRLCLTPLDDLKHASRCGERDTWIVPTSCVLNPCPAGRSTKTSAQSAISCSTWALVRPMTSRSAAERCSNVPVAQHRSAMLIA